MTPSLDAFLATRPQNTARSYRPAVLAWLDWLGKDPARATATDADPPADPLSDEWRIVGRLLAASATQRRQLSSRLVAAALGCGTDRARRLRDYAQAVLDGLADGAAAVCATNDNEVPPDD